MSKFCLRAICSKDVKTICFLVDQEAILLGWEFNPKNMKKKNRLKKKKEKKRKKKIQKINKSFITVNTF